jgi:hypothetical protein
MIKNAKYNIAVVTEAIRLLNFSGMTVEKLRMMHEEELNCSLNDEVSQMTVDVILTAIDMLERPMFN